MSGLVVFHNQVRIVFEGQVAVLIHKVVSGAFLGIAYIGEVVKIEALSQQGTLRYLSFIVGAVGFQNAPILAQGIVDVAHQVVRVGVEAVVIGVAAEV